jgi:type V secretory pathway adhesin AidA
MSGNRQPHNDTALENLSVNSSRRSSAQEDETGNPTHQDGKPDPNESAKVPDQQIPVEQSPEIEDTEGHPT